MARTRIGVVLLLAAAGVLAVAPRAFAHASLQSSDPADGAVLRAAPAAVTLTFSEPPDPTLTAVHVLDRSGQRVESGPQEAVPGEPMQISVPLPPLPDGVYTVTWRTVSETDGHVTAGSFSFGVGMSPAGAPQPSAGRLASTPPPSPLAVAGKWALYAGLALMLAAGSTGVVAFDGRLPARRAVLIGAAILAVTGTAAMIAAERSTVGVGLGTLLSSSAGAKLVWLAIAVAIAAVVGVASALRPTRVLTIFLAVSAAAAMLVRAIGGHASGAGFAGLNVVLQWIHLLGVGVWIGGLAWLLLVVRADGTLERGRNVRRFSQIAAVGLLAVAGTGILRAVDELGGWSSLAHLLETSYGVSLAIKVALSLVLIGLGAVNRYVTVPRYERGGRTTLSRVVGGELLVAAGVFALTGVLTGLPPAVQGRQAATPVARPLVVTGNDFATTTRVRLRVTPGTVGPNEFVATVTDYDSGEPIEADRVSLTFTLSGQPDVGSTLQLKPTSGGVWSAECTALAIDGEWHVFVLIQNSSGSTEVQLHLVPRTPAQNVEVSRAPDQPDLYTITLTGGFQIQAYVDPGSPGINQVHITAFDAAGQELPLASASVRATAPNGDSEPLDMQRFGPGHFAANVDVVPGTWSFSIQATAEDGSVLSASFQQTIAG
jgi:copper transport protein